MGDAGGQPQRRARARDAARRLSATMPALGHRAARGLHDFSTWARVPPPWEAGPWLGGRTCRRLALGLACSWETGWGRALTDGLKLTTYFGERDRAGEHFLADALVDLYARHRLRARLRGVEGFGVRHHPTPTGCCALRTCRWSPSPSTTRAHRGALDEVVALSATGDHPRARACPTPPPTRRGRGGQAHRLPRPRRAGRRPTGPQRRRRRLRRHGGRRRHRLLGVDGTSASAGARASSPPTRRCRS